MSKVYFLGLLHLNCFIVVSSEHTMAVNFCPEGFFGPDCKYKCHCKNLGSRVGCHINGQCFEGDDCETPYFGYLCQYINVANDISEGTVFYNDQDLRTCNNRSANRDIRLSFKNLYLFHFLSLRFVHPETREQDESMSDIQLYLGAKGMAYGRLCRELDYLNISRTKADIYCPDLQNMQVEWVALRGTVATVICEVYFSAGRDVSHLGQSSFTILEQLDNTSYTVNDTSCFLAMGQRYPFVWTYKFDVRPQVFQLVFYTIRGKHPLQEFDLFITEKGKIHQRTFKTTQEKYVVNFDTRVLMDKLDLLIETGSTKNPYISICGLQVYGDCPVRRSGVDCVRPCDACSKDNVKCDVDGQCFKEKCDIDGHCFRETSRFGNSIILATECANCAPGSECANGICSLGCQPGFKGDKCIEECGNCGVSKDCDQQSGFCLGGCAKGYSGKLCIQPCGMCSDRRCDPLNQTCLSGECQPGYKGHNCFKRCQRCGGSGRCDINTGTCLENCKVGFRGDVCLLKCTNCAGNGACEQKTGHCLHGCNFGYKGKSCSERCTNCGGDGECDPETGHCKKGCQHGFKGQSCSLPCTFCRGLECNTTTGRCLRGCVTGHYHYECERVCHNCAGDGSCQGMNGKCRYGCIDGFYTDQCSEVCQNCGGKMACDVKKGICTEGCKHGFHGEFCKDLDSLNENLTSTSTLVSYVYFIVCMAIVLFIVFFGQTVFTACYLPARESLDSLRSMKTSSGSTATRSTPEGIGEYGVLAPKEKPKFIKLTDWIIDTKRSQGSDLRRMTMTSGVDDGRTSFSSSSDKMSQRSYKSENRDKKEPKVILGKTQPRQTTSLTL